jgi:bifunctional DNase/RNase
MDRSIDVEYIVVDDVHDETYFASMAFNDGTLVDCRPSDAISIAIRLGSPIFINDNVVDSMSFEYKNVKGMQEEKEETTQKKTKRPSKKKQKDESANLSVEELQKRLEEAIDKEDYETAVKLRDMINRR